MRSMTRRDLLKGAASLHRRAAWHRRSAWCWLWRALCAWRCQGRPSRAFWFRRSWCWRHRRFWLTRKSASRRRCASRCPTPCVAWRRAFMRGFRFRRHSPRWRPRFLLRPRSRSRAFRTIWSWGIRWMRPWRVSIGCRVCPSWGLWPWRWMFSTYAAGAPCPSCGLRRIRWRTGSTCAGRFQARLSAQVVSIMPFFLLALLSLISPGFLNPFFADAQGVAVLALAISMQVAGVLMVRRMLAVEL